MYVFEKLHWLGGFCSTYVLNSGVMHPVRGWRPVLWNTKLSPFLPVGVVIVTYIHCMQFHVDIRGTNQARKSTIWKLETSHFPQQMDHIGFPLNSPPKHGTSKSWKCAKEYILLVFHLGNNSVFIPYQAWVLCCLFAAAYVHLFLLLFKSY